MATTATAGGWAEKLLGRGGMGTGAGGMPAFFATSPGAIMGGIRTNTGSGQSSPIVSIVGWLVAVVVIVTVILLFVHFTIRPIFRIVPGGKGIISIPGFSDGQLYWKPGSAIAPLIETKLPASYPTQNWSFTLDIFVNNPTVLTSEPAMVFSRGTGHKQGTVEENLVEVLLVPGSNDLVISVRNSLRNSENILLSNVPVQTPFRLGVVIMDVAMEVYINGRLMKTRAFDAPPINYKGMFVPPQGDASQLVKLSNLHLWNRILTPSEIRYAKPALVSSSLFKDNKLTGALSSCADKTIDQMIPAGLTTKLSSAEQQLSQSSTTAL